MSLYRTATLLPEWHADLLPGDIWLTQREKDYTDQNPQVFHPPLSVISLSVLTRSHCIRPSQKEETVAS